MSKSQIRRLYGLAALKGFRRWRSLRKTSVVHFEEGFSLCTFPWLYPPHWERAERAEIARLLISHDLFVDVGANHGVYSVLADHFGIMALAVEPEDSNLAVLAKNAEGRKIMIVASAAGARAGTLALFGNQDVASTLPEWNGEDYFRQNVPVETLDSIIARLGNGRRLLIKIDVEGAEDRVLEGARDTLARPATWMIETFRTMPSGVASPAFERVFAIMHEAGYRGKLVSGSTGNWLFEKTGKRATPFRNSPRPTSRSICD